MTIETAAVWTLLAFVLWLAMTLACAFLRLKRTAVAAAILSWLIARAAMSMLPPLLEWIHSHLLA